MDLADVHAHLDMVKDREAAIRRAAAEGVQVIVNNSVDPDSNRKSLELQEKHEIVKAALGIYPVNAVEMADSEVSKEISFIKENGSRIAAIGEIGLDYQETADRARQHEVFGRLLGLAKDLGKPVIVHSRKAEKEVIEALMDAGSERVILHAFHGSMKLVREGSEKGFCFSVPSNILRSSHFQKLVEIAPIGNLLTETDSPYLGPLEDKRSEPAFVKMTVEKIAKIKGIKPEATANGLWNNYRRMFLS